VFVVIFVTFCAYLFNILALREVHSSVVGAYIYLQPILAAVISIAVGKDALSWNKIIAALFIFTGVFLVAFGNQFFRSKAIKEL
jgi:drug/metabolite transporter (DMT)-like permease